MNIEDWYRQSVKDAVVDKSIPGVRFPMNSRLTDIQVTLGGVEQVEVASLLGGRKGDTCPALLFTATMMIDGAPAEMAGDLLLGENAKINAEWTD